MAIKIEKKDVLWGYLGQILYSGINILVLPFVIRMLPPKKLGLWFNFTSIGALAMLLDFGFMTTITRNVAYAWSGAQTIAKDGIVESQNSNEPNIKLFLQILKVSKTIYLLVGMIALFFLLSFGTLYMIGISKGEIASIEYLPAWIVYVFAIFMNIYYAYWAPMLKGVGAIKQNYQAMIFSKVVQLIFSIVGLLFGFELLAIAVAYLLGVIINRMLSKYYFDNYDDVMRRKKEMDFIRISKFECKQTFKHMWPSAYKQGLMSFANYMTDKVSILVCSSVFGLVASSMLGLTVQLLGVVSTIGNVLYNSYLPAIIQCKTQGKREGAYTIFSRCLGIQFIINILGGACIALFGNLALGIIGSQSKLLPIEQTILLVMYVTIFNFQILCSNYIVADNRMPMFKAYIYSGVITVIGEVLFAKIFFQYGSWTIISTQFVVLLAYNAWKWPIYIARQQGISVIKMFGDSLKNVILFAINFKDRKVV